MPIEKNKSVPNEYLAVNFPRIAASIYIVLIISTLTDIDIRYYMLKVSLLLQLHAIIII